MDAHVRFADGACNPCGLAVPTSVKITESTNLHGETSRDAALRLIAETRQVARADARRRAKDDAIVQGIIDRDASKVEPWTSAASRAEALSVDLPKEDLSVKEQCCGNGSNADLSEAEKKARLKVLLAKKEDGSLGFAEEWELSTLASGAELSRQRVDRRRRKSQAILVGHAPIGRSFDTNNGDQLTEARRGKWYSVSACSIVPLDLGMSLEQRASGKVDRNGVFRCGSAWTCPSCQQRIAVPRAKQIREVQEAVREQGGLTAMFTFTIPHDKETTFDQGMQRLKDAWRYFRQDGTVRDRMQRHGYCGHVHSTEVTRALKVDPRDPNTFHDFNWHIHGHGMYVFQFDGALNMTGGQDKEWALKVKIDLFPAWHRACLKAGAPRPPSFEHGFDVRVAWSATDYIQKLEEHAKPKAQAKQDAGKPRWGIEAELTKSYMKEGRKKSRTPFELLDSDDPKDHDLFREYARGTFGRSQIEWSRGKYDLRKRFLGEDYADLTDEEAAAADPEWEFADEHVAPDADAIIERADIARDDCWRARKLGRNAMDRAIAAVDGGGAVSLEHAMREAGFTIDDVREATVVEEIAVDDQNRIIYANSTLLIPQMRSVFVPKRFVARYSSRTQGGDQDGSSKNPESN